MNEYKLSREELIHVVQTFSTVLEELDAIDEGTDWVLTTGVREEIDESLLIIESAIMSIDKTDGEEAYAQT